MSLRRQFWSGKVYYNKNATCLNEVVQEDPKKTEEEKNMTLKGMQSMINHTLHTHSQQSMINLQSLKRVKVRLAR